MADNNATDIAQQPDTNGATHKSSTPLSRNGWDGKLRVNKQAVLANPEALSDPDYSDEDAPPVDEIAADESAQDCLRPSVRH